MTLIIVDVNLRCALRRAPLASCIRRTSGAQSAIELSSVTTRPEQSVPVAYGFNGDARRNHAPHITFRPILSARKHTALRTAPTAVQCNDEEDDSPGRRHARSASAAGDAANCEKVCNSTATYRTSRRRYYPRSTRGARAAADHRANSVRSPLYTPPSPPEKLQHLPSLLGVGMHARCRLSRRPVSAPRPRGAQHTASSSTGRHVLLSPHFPCGGGSRPSPLRGQRRWIRA